MRSTLVELFKAAPYSCTKYESSSNLRALEEKRLCFSIFYDLNMSTKKAKLTVNFLAFPSEKFGRLVVSILLWSELVFQGNL